MMRQVTMGMMICNFYVFYELAHVNPFRPFQLLRQSISFISAFAKSA